MKSLDILAIDVGTTWAKLGVMRWTDPDVTLLDEARVARDPANQASWTEAVLDRAGKYVESFRLRGIGITCFRESLHIVDAEGHQVRDADALITTQGVRPRGGESALSGAGYLAYRLTGHRAITPSEQHALVTVYPDLDGHMGSTKEVSIGAEVGRFRGIPVSLTGTDEQSAHMSSGLGRGTDLAIAVASFWSFSQQYHGEPPPPPVRCTPRFAALPAAASLIGYRWGILLRQLMNGEQPHLTDELPDWAFGRLVDRLRDPMQTLTYPEALELVKADAIWAASSLTDLTGQPTANVTLHGGGLRHLPGALPMLQSAFGPAARVIPYDASMLGTVISLLPKGTAIHPVALQTNLSEHI